MPALFQSPRGLIDEGRCTGYRAGLFLILGSGLLDLLRQSGESWAGRIAYVNMELFDILETAAANSDDDSAPLWVRADSQKAISPRTIGKACVGAESSSVLSWSGKPLCSVPRRRLKPSNAYERCWPMSRAAY